MNNEQLRRWKKELTVEKLATNGRSQKRSARAKDSVKMIKIAMLHNPTTSDRGLESKFQKNVLFPYNATLDNS